MISEFLFGVLAGCLICGLIWLSVSYARERHLDEIDDWTDRMYAPPRIEPPEFRPNYRPPPVVTKITKHERTIEI